MESTPDSDFLDDREYLKAMLDTIPEAFVVYSLEGKPLMWNRAYRDYVGYEDDEIRGMMAWDFHSPEDVEYVAESFKKVIQTGEPMFIETVVRNKEGERIPGILSGSCLRNEKGEPIALCGIGRDITARKAAEEALRESEELYRTLSRCFLIQLC